MYLLVSMASDRLYFSSVEIDQSYSLTLPPWKNLCHRRSRDAVTRDFLNLVPRVLSLLRESTLVTAGHVSARF